MEVLVALAITSVIMASLYSAFFLSRRAVDAVDDSLVKMQEYRAVLDVMKREIESSVYDPGKISGGKAYTAFKIVDKDFYGKQTSQLSFTSFSPLLPGISRISYSVDDYGGRLSLKKNIASAYAQAGDPKDAVLMEDVESFAVEAKYNDKWVKTWDGALANGLPEEVKISMGVSIKKGETPLMISETVRPKYKAPW